MKNASKSTYRRFDNTVSTSDDHLTSNFPNNLTRDDCSGGGGSGGGSGGSGGIINGVSKNPGTSVRSHYKTFDEADEWKGKMERNHNGMTPERKADRDNARNEDDVTFTLQEAIDSMGFGLYQISLSCMFGLNLIADTMEIMLLSVISPVLKCVFHLTPFQESLLTIVVFTGMLISGGFWGKVGDVYGRTKAILISSMVCGYFGVLRAFSPAYPWVVINRFLVSLGLGGFLQLYTLYTEFVPGKARSYCIVLIGLIWGLGSCVEVLLSMVTLKYLDWRWLLVFTSLPVIIFVCLFRFLPESPRYLLIHGRYQEAVDILTDISRINRKPLPPGRLFEPPVTVTGDNSRIKDLFSPKFLRTTLLISIGLIATNMAYYGTALLTTSLFDKNDGCHGYTSGPTKHHVVTCRSHCKSLTTEDYMDLFFTSLGDTPGPFLCMLLMAYLGRTTSLAILTGAYGLLMSVANICAPRLVLVALLFGARCFAVGCSQGIYVYITEVYPTSIRGIGMGWAQLIKSAGVIIAALVSNMIAAYSTFLAISCYAVVGFVGAFSIWALPYETKNKNLADTVEDHSL